MPVRNTAAQYSPLFATQHSSGGTTAHPSVRNSTLVIGIVVGKVILGLNLGWGYYLGVILEGKAGQAGWARILVQNAPILVKNGPSFDRNGQIHKIPVEGGHVVCSQHTALSCVRDTAFLWWDHSTCLCSRHSILLVRPQHFPLFATQHSSDGTTAPSSDCNSSLLWSGHSTFVY